MSDITRLARFLETAEQAGNKINPEAATRELAGINGVLLRRMNPGGLVANAGDPIRSVYVLLSGRCHILASSGDGRRFVTYDNGELEIYGLTEMLAGKNVFSASITAVEECRFALIEWKAFLHLLEHDISAANYTLRYLGRLVENAGEISSRRLLTTKYESIVLYFHTLCQNRQLPYVVPLSRPALAELLGVSLRSLFRYTDRLSAGGYIEVRNGRIMITEENNRNLRVAAQEIYRRVFAS